MATTLKLGDRLAISDKLKTHTALLQNKVNLHDSLSIGDGFKLVEQGIQLQFLADSLNLLDSIIQGQQNKSGNVNSDSILISDSLQLLLVPLLQLTENLTLS